jgi:ubiquinone/menaquinone biosynthesis C-methylase UbiE
MATDQEQSKDGVTSFFSQASTAFGSDEGIRRFPHFGRRLVEVAELPTGAHVLDVATGRGAILFPAAERVGLEGSVLGIDIAPGMIEATAQDIKGRGLTNATVRLMDAENLDLAPASLDAILCGFGIMFLPHLAQALAGFRRVLRPGGLLGVSTWADPDPRFEWERELQRAYGIADRTAASFMAQRLHDPNDLANALRGAGFSDVNVIKEVDERIHRDPEEWWARTLMAGPSRAALQALDPERLERYQQDAFQHLRGLADGEGRISQRIEANFSFGHKP